MKTSFPRALSIAILAAFLTDCRGDKTSTTSSSSAALTAAPAAPSDLEVVAVNAGQANLTWVDNSADETELRVQRASDEAFEVTLVETILAPDVTQYTDFTIEGLHTYFYRVLAVNANGASAPSEEVRIFTPASSPTVAVAEPAGSPALFQSGLLNQIRALATGVGAPIASAEYQLLLADAPGVFLAQDIASEPNQDPFVIPAPISLSPVADVTPVPPLPPGAIVELQIFGRVAQAGADGNGFEWRVGGSAASPTFIVYESPGTVFPRPRRPLVGDAVWITAHRTAAPGPLVAKRVTFRAPEPQPVAPAAYKVAALYRGVIQSFETAFVAPGVSYGGSTATVFNALDNLAVPFRFDYPTGPAFPGFVDEGLIAGNAVEVRFWVSRPTDSLPIARQIFPQVQVLDLPPTNPNPSHFNDDPVPMGLPPGTHLQFMINGVVTGIDMTLKTWQLGDPADPVVVYGHALTIPVTDGFRTVPDIGDEVIVTARRTLAPGPLIADQILLLADGPAPAFELAETRTQLIYLYNGNVTAIGPTSGGTRWTVSISGIPQDFVMNDPDEPAVVDRGPLASIGSGTPVTVEFLPPTQTLPENNWGPLAFNPASNLWEVSTDLPAVPEDRTGILFVRTTDTANQSSSIAIPAQLLAGVNPPPPPVPYTFTPVADARVQADQPDSNFGTQNWLGADLSPVIHESYLRFQVTGVGTVQSAKLRFFLIDGSSNGPAVFSTGTSWSETGITWNNRPPASGAALANLGAVSSGLWVEYDVTSAVTGNGLYGFKWVADSTNGTDAYSREGQNPPQLVVTASGGSSCVPTTCASEGKNCGYLSDGCGGTLVCGACGGPETCGGGGVANVCGGAGQPTVLTFTPSADARVRNDNPSTNYGSSDWLGADLSPVIYESYLLFNVSGVAGAVQSARLRFFLIDGSSNGPALYSTGTGWTEAGITWDNRPPAAGAALGNLGAVSTGSWVEYDVTAAVAGNGLYGFKLVADSGNGTDASSREGVNPPQLLITY